MHIPDHIVPCVLLEIANILVVLKDTPPPGLASLYDSLMSQMAANSDMSSDFNDGSLRLLIPQSSPAAGAPSPFASYPSSPTALESRSPSRSPSQSRAPSRAPSPSPFASYPSSPTALESRSPSRSRAPSRAPSPFASYPSSPTALESRSPSRSPSPSPPPLHMSKSLLPFSDFSGNEFSSESLGQSPGKSLDAATNDSSHTTHDVSESATCDSTSHGASGAKRPRLMTEGDDGGHEGGGGGPGHAVNWGPECRRKGDRARLRRGGGRVARGWASDAADPLPCSHGVEQHAMFSWLSEEEVEDDPDIDNDDDNYEPNDAGADHHADNDYIPPPPAKKKGTKNRGSRKRKNKTTWLIDGQPPPLSDTARQQVISLTSVTSRSNCETLKFHLTNSLVAETSAANPTPNPNSPTSDPLATVHALGRRCKALEMDVRLTDFKFMVALLQLMLSVDILQKKLRGRQCPGLSTLAGQCGVSPTKFRDWVAHGTRLAYLVAAGTPHILLVIAVMGMRADITRRQNSSNDDIYGLAFALRNPTSMNSQDDAIGKMVQGILVPFLIRLRHEAPLRHLSFSFFSQSTLGDVDVYGAGAIMDLDTHFNEVATKFVFHMFRPNFQSAYNYVTVSYYLLPPRGDSWFPSSTPSLPALSPAPIDEIAETVTIKTLKPFPKTPCPISKENREEWTEDQRLRAGKAGKAVDLKDLESKARIMILRRPLSSLTPRVHSSRIPRTRDRENTWQLTPKFAKSCNVQLLAQLDSLFPNELYYDTSDRKDYNFLAVHYSWYNRYGERGDAAPQNIHPHYVHKEGANNINHSQRVPYCSQDIQNDPKEYGLLVEFLQDILNFVNANVGESSPSFLSE
ncbi:hypothetical protein FPV67DRAFT_1459498 [Lyophyllum atratum]|nr:hypothetical protein FPV67DRAFT_1459498 [Lyophyllum atratum]